jgi:hypothetical protein
MEYSKIGGQRSSKGYEFTNVGLAHNATKQ